MVLLPLSMILFLSEATLWAHFEHVFAHLRLGFTHRTLIVRIDDLLYIIHVWIEDLAEEEGSGRATIRMHFARVRLTSVVMVHGRRRHLVIINVDIRVVVLKASACSKWQLNTASVSRWCRIFKLLVIVGGEMPCNLAVFCRLVLSLDHCQLL